MEYAEALEAARAAWLHESMTEPLVYNGTNIRGHIEIGSFRGDSFQYAGDSQSSTAYAYLPEADLAEIEGAPAYQDSITDGNGKVWKVLHEVSRSAGIVELAVASDVRPIL